MMSGTHPRTLLDSTKLPSTRYRGSKRRQAVDVHRELVRLQPTRLYDAFGGSGIVSAVSDTISVPSNYIELYHWSSRCARVLLHYRYSEDDARDALMLIDNALCRVGDGFVTTTFQGCYFTRSENREIDSVLDAIRLEARRKIADLVFYGLAQACIAKRPMAMFHRRSLSQRLANVERRNGNKRIWNAHLGDLMPGYVEEAASFTRHRRAVHRVIEGDALKILPRLSAGETLFLDPPYLNPRGGVPTYQEAYHFLEGMSRGAAAWEKGLNWNGRHPIFRGSPSSSFDDADGWIKGVGRLVRRARAGAVIGTARRRDRPGAGQLREILLEEFDKIRVQRMPRPTIFAHEPNPEYMFVAS